MTERVIWDAYISLIDKPLPSGTNDENIDASTLTGR